jgi:hypothetical protein
MKGPVLLARCGLRIDSRGALLASRQQRTLLHSASNRTSPIKEANR